MTLQSDLPRNVRRSLVKARDKWGWFVALGVLLLILGGIAFANLLVATVASVYFVGSMMLIGGIVEIAHAFGVLQGRFFLLVPQRPALRVAGLFAFWNPLLASSVLTLLLAVALAASGGFRIAFAMSNKDAQELGMDRGGRRHFRSRQPAHHAWLAGKQPVDPGLVPGC